MQYHIGLLRACLIRSTIENKGIFNVSLTEFKSACRDFKISIDLMIDPSAIGSQSGQYGPDTFLIIAAGFDFNDADHKKKVPKGDQLFCE
jgi:hypothetical protein